MEMDKIEAIFSITHESDFVLLLKPKHSGSHLTQMQITLAPLPRVGGLFIQKVHIHEENKNRSQFTFKNFKINKKLPDAVFLLKIPEGVEVIDLQ
jgi:outer membrane lipoprotein-sorting protein